MISLGILASARRAASGITAAFLQDTGSSASASSFTFTAQNVGAASATRRVVVAVVARGGSGINPTVSTATIGGVSATVDQTGGTGRNTVAIVSAVVPTGTTADVVVTLTATAAIGCAIGMWAITGAASSVGAGANGSTSATVSSPDGGIVIAGSVNTSNVGATWTGVTEQYDAAFSGTSVSHSGGDAATPTAATVTAAVTWAVPNVTVTAAVAYTP